LRKLVTVLIFLGAVLAADNSLCTLELSNGYKIKKLPVADTSESQAKGLSKVDDIGSGMIFVWGSPRVVSFWMKDTRVPLSIGFFDKDKKLFQVDDMEPFSLSSHLSSKEVIAALELNEGDFKKHNITIGTKIVKLECE
jgi:uncharacterized membrane protein (UPF0127 family)